MVKPGRMLFEMSGVSEPLAREAMRLAAHKLPIETRFIVKGQPETGTEGESDEQSSGPGTTA